MVICAIQNSMDTILDTLRTEAGVSKDWTFDPNGPEDHLKGLSSKIRAASLELSEMAAPCHASMQLAIKSQDVSFYRCTESIWQRYKNCSSIIRKALHPISKNRKTDKLELDYFKMRHPSGSCIIEEIPVTLVSKGFGTFQCELLNNKDASNIPKSSSYFALKLIMEVSTMSHAHESQLRCTVLAILSFI